MKLNIGCGSDWRKGWLNIDPSRDSAADKFMPAEDLSLPDGSAGEIEARHLAEHLGYFKTRYFLSECFRLLRPDGRLVIETPDISAACAAFSAAKTPEAREVQLGWIYGPETEGMAHRYAFPEELLKSLARRAGFDILSVSRRSYYPARSAVSFELSRHEEDREAELQSALRKAVMRKKAEDFSSEIFSAARDEAVDLICSMLVKNDIQSVLTCAIAPTLSKLALELLGPEAKKAAVAASLLVHCGGAALAWRALLTETPKGGAQRSAFARAELSYEKAALRALKTDKLLSAGGAGELPPVFSRHAARAEAEKLAGLARKAAGSGDEDAAARLYGLALSFERDDPRLWLEAGRSFRAARGKAASADYFINGALALEGFKEMGDRDTMRRELMKEMG